MDGGLLPLLGTGLLLGWSVAWPPGPINAEIARRCIARGFWAGFGLNLGASTGDAVWAGLVAVGVGVLFTGPIMHRGLGLLSVLLLLGLALLFLHGAWRALRREGSAAAMPSRFDGSRASYLLGLTLALSSPWNVAFWLAAIARPELAQSAMTTVVAVIGTILVGALSWGLVWAGAVVLLHGRVGSGSGGRWWDVGVKAISGGVMVYFAVRSVRALVGG